MAPRRHESLVPLSHDHREALGLAFRLGHPAPPGPVTLTTPASTASSRADETVEFFERRLAPHFRAEEGALFPALRVRLGPGAPVAALLDDLVADHRRFERLRDRIEVARDDEERERLLAEFAGVLEQHVRREERELFSIFPDLIDDEVEALRVGEAILATLGERAAICRSR
jgi:hypothetical protein